jgi:hypothetical protein
MQRPSSGYSYTSALAQSPSLENYFKISWGLCCCNLELEGMLFKAIYICASAEEYMEN